MTDDTNEINRKVVDLLRNMDPDPNVPGPTPMEAMGLHELLEGMTRSGALGAMTNIVAGLAASGQAGRLKAIALSEGMMYLCKVSQALRDTPESRKTLARAVANADQARSLLITIMERGSGGEGEAPAQEEEAG